MIDDAKVEEAMKNNQVTYQEGLLHPPQSGDCLHLELYVSPHGSMKGHKRWTCCTCGKVWLELQGVFEEQ
jgi:hypothetical protein